MSTLSKFLSWRFKQNAAALRISLLAGCLTGLLPSQTPADVSVLQIDNRVRSVLQGNVHPQLSQARLLGRAPAGMPMQRMILSLQASPEARKRLEDFLAQQQEPTSPNYHHWLTPEQFGMRFGPSQDQVKTVSAWLLSQGFSIDEVAPSRMSITFSGTREQVELAFGTTIMDYDIDGQTRHANATEPSIPSALTGFVNGVVTLHDIPRKSFLGQMKAIPRRNAAPAPGLTIGSNHYLGPGDFATIYDVNTLYGAGFDGTGVTIAIVGRSNIHVSDVAAFRSDFGLPVKNPVIVLNGPNPGVLTGGEEDEAVLDVTWSGAVAKAATVKFVVSASTFSADGVDLSAQYIVDHDLAPVMSVSFGLCERDLGTTGNTFYHQLWSQAAAEGITVCVSTGDNGPAGCDSPGATSGTIHAVSGLASTPYNIAVGGSQFNEGAGSYWNPANPSDQFASTALSYIPEIPWNESGLEAGGSGLWAGSGGPSSKYAKPVWQVSPGVPGDSKRDIPDVSLTAALHDGYYVVVDGSAWVFGGTSASSPSFAGLMALVVQRSGRQGNANPTLYRLGNMQYASTGASVFNDAVTGDNSVPGVTGYTAATGYDMATGLGSVDAANLVYHWDDSNSLGLSISPRPAMAPVRGTIVFTAAATGLASSNIHWTTTGGQLSASVGSPVTWTAPAAAGTYTITATNGLDATMTDSVPITVKSLDLLGDGHGTADVLDAAALAWAYGSHPGDSNWLEAADLNGDRVIDDQDIALFLSLTGF
jgi:pseudomonalisin